jgi:hypothetical protein
MDVLSLIVSDNVGRAVPIISALPHISLHKQAPSKLQVARSPSLQLLKNKPMLSSSAKAGMRFGNAKSLADKKLHSIRPRTKVAQEELKKAGSILKFMPLPRGAPPKGKQQSASTPSPPKTAMPSCLLTATETEQGLSKQATNRVKYQVG